MKVKKMKIISKIVNEIASFYLEKGAKDVKIDITENDQKNGYIIHCKIKKNMEIHQDIEYLEYWELIGEGETSEELTLVARLCDSIYINHENGVLELILKKIL